MKRKIIYIVNVYINKDLVIIESQCDCVAGIWAQQLIVNNLTCLCSSLWHDTVFLFHGIESVKNQETIKCGIFVSESLPFLATSSGKFIENNTVSAIKCPYTSRNELLTPKFSLKPTLGTNPVSIAALGNHGDNFVLDMATKVVAAGKLKIIASKDSNLPANMIVDVNGHVSIHTNDNITTIIVLKNLQKI
ncbi:unnamed protein product [Mytilus coruscus]|uniref:Uncharacterized protein n=1 Tax=Mytilus coruscus TaxID=42192 RepID=A0A6J7ZZF7_MYTCO|nr:unnamed protein product [Mytilus coruscus]